ncbi:hypothetical protein [Nocardia sp. NPDC056100]|uniref:hypothetical protein n=1 Tax=Nocardia sp. NPDC056100 TaxID=3345712 RepID=UPI0035DA2AFD
MVATLECAAVATLIPEFIVGLSARGVPADPDQPAGSTNCLWYSDAHSLSIGQEPLVTSKGEMDRIRAGKVYTEDTPLYRIVQNDRLTKLGAVAVMRADSDSFDEPGSMATVHLHTPTTRITVAGWTAESVLEIATRIAEKLRGMLDRQARGPRH